jgi:hypothetical protein
MTRVFAGQHYLTGYAIDIHHELMAMEAHL